MKKKLFTLLTLLVTCASGAWATADIIYALSSFERTGDAEPYTYTMTFDQVKYKGKTVWVEVPSANSTGTITFKSDGTSSDRLLYIYKSNGTVADDTRSLPMNPKDWVTPVNYYPSDILTDGEPGSEKYYLVIAGATTSTDWKGSGVRFTARTISSKYTVTFNAGTNGTCATASATEATVGGGVTLPDVTPNDGYVFNGWYTESSGGTKIGDAGDTYNPESDVIIYAQYLLAVAPTITTQPVNVTTAGGNRALFSVVATGTPNPNYQWYTCNSDGSGASAIGGATSASYIFAAPDYDAEGTNTYYYKVTASNSVGNVTSNVVSLTVTNKIACSGYLTATSGTASTYNCSMAFYGDEGSLSTIPAGTASGDYYYCKMNDNKNYYQLSITGGFKAGDILTVYLYGSTKAYKVGKTAQTAVSVSGTSAVAGVNHTLAASEIESDGTLRIYRNSSNTFFAGTSVTGSNTLNIIADYKYATFVTTRAIDMAKANADGVKAYIVTGKGDSSITTEEVTEIPANTAILLKASDETGHSIAVDAIISATLSSANKLKASDGNVTGDGSTIFGFFKVGDEYGFAPVSDGTTLAAGKAYLQIEGGELQARFYALDLEGETTGVSATLMNNERMNNEVYNLNGQRVAQPTKGLYIVNGKKVIIK